MGRIQAQPACGDELVRWLCLSRRLPLFGKSQGIKSAAS